MRKEMTIGNKLMIGFGSMLALLAGLAYTAFTWIGSLNHELDTALTKTAKKTELAAQMDAANAYLRAGQQGVILYSALKDPVMLQKSAAAFGAYSERMSKLVGSYQPLISSQKGRLAIETIQTQTAAWQPLFRQVAQLSEAGQFRDINPLIAQTLALADRIQKATDQLQQNQRLHLAESAKAAEEASSRARWMAVLLVGICVAVSAAILWLIWHINATLRQIAAEMENGAEQVAAAASEVSSSSQSLAQGASDQAASIQQTSSSSEEINSMARQNAENSKAAADNMVQAAQRVADANRNLAQMVSSMNEINASSEKISKIIKVIDEIAFQTNILALNAAVEAARAGEAGMGFAVVADEVRNLSQRCARAASDTTGLIEESIAKSNDGKAKLSQVAEAVRSITDSAERVKTLVDEVSLGSQEQARGIEQVSKAITHMEKVIQTTAATAQQSASASEELSAQSETLHGIVNRLNNLVGGVTQGSSAQHGIGSRCRAGVSTSRDLQSSAVLSGNHPPHDVGPLESVAIHSTFSSRQLPQDGSTL